MDVSLSEDQLAMREGVAAVLRAFGDDYWLARDEDGGGMAAASSVHINLFGPNPIVAFGTPEQKARWIPRLVQGLDQVAYGFTEPDAGLNTTAIKTFAQKVDGGYRVRDRQQPCGAEANAAKFLGARSGHDACQQAVLTQGGFGYVKECRVERLLREVMITRLAPVSEQMILFFIAEKVQDLPRSY
jgi:alkylation response protein AidB-like acyl-CoA dehydrogenase